MVGSDRAGFSGAGSRRAGYGMTTVRRRDAGGAGDRVPKAGRGHAQFAGIAAGMRGRVVRMQREQDVRAQQHRRE